MALVSPGIETKEIDLTTVVSAVSAAIGAYAGRFNWGPIGIPVLVSNEDDLGSQFGQPKSAFSATQAEANSIATSFLTASSYLAYADALRVSRVANVNDSVPTNNARNAVSTLTSGDTPTGILIKNRDHYLERDAQAELTNYFLVGKYAGSLGSSIGVSAVFTAEQYKSASDIAASDTWTLNKNNSGAKTLAVSSLGTPPDLTVIFTAGDYVTFQYNSIEYKNQIKTVAPQLLTFEDIGADLPYFPAASTTGVVTNIRKQWKYANAVTSAPSTNEFHLVLIDNDGKITGEAGNVLEVYPFLSTEISKKNADGTTAYYKDVLNDLSAYVWAGSASLTAKLASADKYTFVDVLTDGNNGTAPTQDDYMAAYDVFADKENVDVSFIIAPPLVDSLTDSVVHNYLIQNIAEVRKDVVVYLSPRYSDVVNKPKLERANVIAFRNTLTSSSYAFMDSGWKYMYDKYNNTFRWVPLCGDIAGTAARTDDERDSWWSHAGFNRGIIKNVIKLAWNPSQADRDDLYQVGVNPVVTFNGSGSVLFGDKTLLDRPSAFDRINVRRLFIVLEKAISDASKSSLFEFNDEFTRSRFVNIVEPFLRDVQSRRGITAFKVVCDSTNNTAQVIDTNRFIGDIYIKPARSINFITLNFVAVQSGVEFSTVVGQF